MLCQSFFCDPFLLDFFERISFMSFSCGWFSSFAACCVEGFQKKEEVIGFFGRFMVVPILFVGKKESFCGFFFFFLVF